MDLLEQAVQSLKAGLTPDFTGTTQQVEVELNISALIPDDYIPDVHSRLILYKRLSSMTNKLALKELKVEFIDRFGPIPEALTTLMAITELKLKAKAMGITQIKANRRGGKITFDKQPMIDPTRLIALIQRSPRQFKLEGQAGLCFNFNDEALKNRVGWLQELLTSIEKPAA